MLKNSIVWPLVLIVALLNVCAVYGDEINPVTITEGESIPIIESQQKKYDVYGSLAYPDGKPAPGVHIIVFHRGDYLDVVTDVNGNYAVTVSGPDPAFFVEPDQYGLLFFLMIMDGSPSPIKQNLKLEHATLITGEVTDAYTGQPVVDAQVALESPIMPKTGLDGAFKVSVLPRTKTLMEIRKPGYVLKRLTINSIDTKTVALHIKLTPGGTIRGRVVDQNNKPVVGANIHSEVDPELLGVEIPLFATTDADGRYEIRDVDPTKPLGLHAEDYSILLSEIRTFEFQKESNETTGDFVVNLKGKERRNITGRITDENGNSIADAEVRCGRGNWPLNRVKTKTDAQGYYKFNDFVIEKQMMLVQADGFAPGFIPVSDGSDLQINAELKKANMAQVHVVDISGKPLEGVEITVNTRTPILARMFHEILSGDDICRGLFIAKTDEKGDATLNNLPAGDVLVSLVKQNYCPLSDMPLDINSKKNLITMKGVTQFAGTVVDSITGTPIPGYKLNWLNLHDGSWSYYRYMTYGHQQGKFLIQQSDIYVDNRGHALVRIIADGYINEEMAVTVTKFPDIDYSNVFKLHKSFTVKGRIVDSEGRGIADAKVVVLNDRDYRYSNYPLYTPDNPDVQVFTTGPDGSFTIDPVIMRKGTLFVTKQGYPKTIKSEVDLTKPVKVVLPAGSTLTVKASGLATKGSKVIWRFNNDGSSDKQPLLADGKVVFPDLRAGRYTITAGVYGKSKVQTIDLYPGQDFILDMDKKSNVRVKIIFTRNGAPVPGVQVQTRPEDGSLDVYSISDIRGECHFGLEKPGLAIIGYQEVDGERGTGYTPVNMPQLGLVINNFQVAPGQRAKGFYETALKLKLGDNRINIKLPSGKLSGYLLDAETLKPIEGKILKACIKGTPPLYLRYDEPYRNPGFFRDFRLQARTSREGAFTFYNLPSESLILTGSFNPNFTTYVSNPIVFDAKHPANDIRLKMLGHGRLQVSLVDSVSGMFLRAMPMMLQTSTFAPVYIQGGSHMPIPVPPGKYVLWISPDDGRHSRVKTHIEVLPWKLLHVTIKLTTTKQRIVFKAVKGSRFEDLAWPDKPSTFFPGPVDAPAENDGEIKCRPWIGFTISDAMTGKTVLTGPNGPTWGGVLPGFNINREAVLRIKPGKYVLDAVLRNTENYSVKPFANLWKIHTKITVTAGKDTVITIK